MHITYLKLKNWRNFRDAEIHLSPRTYVIGPNASGKSNLLDVFRFLRDLSKPAGGGLQKAVKDRDGITKLRCLHARKDTEVRLEVHLAEEGESPEPAWKYILGFKPEGKGTHRLLVSAEQVWREGRCLFERPNTHDVQDEQLLTQTHLEQIQANGEFRDIADFFSNVTYLHLVPQLLKYGDKIGGQRLEDDPFGQGFLERIAKCPAKTRDARLRKITKALSAAVPQFKDLRFQADKVSGRPHLEALYEHHRPHGAWQREEHFSDGTLRLIGLLWSLLDGDSLLLLEEPELSLNQGVVEQIPLLIDRLLRQSKHRRQVIISTHSEALLGNPGIDGRDVVVLESTTEGSRIRGITQEEHLSLQAGLSVADVVLPKTRPQEVSRLGSWGQ
ncbi:MAG: AAA family ATPase [Gammaproteobacteria bacterium]|nr:AAA family ATPase [Gammaproteobacteria bacterium]MBU1655443.1 AAA family ATPase [Gammaproteobacteria bacterium]MBU1962410.1 AAA family ATPase [Gammaproteobacteria bacterium]